LRHPFAALRPTVCTVRQGRRRRFYKTGIADCTEKWFTLPQVPARDISAMQYKPETPTKSISELLAMFMRQAAVEVVAKRADVRRDISIRRSKK
jgi:hypothetical protein